MSETTQKALAANTRATGATFLQTLKSMAPQIVSALPKHMTVDRTLRLVLTEFRKNPTLGECAPETVAGAIITLSQMGLEIGVLGQAYLVPYWNTRANRRECQGIPGWQGIVDLINRAGRGTVWSGAVYDEDAFDYELGSEPFVRHKPGPKHGAGELLYTYAVGKPKGSEVPIIEVWSAMRLKAHRDRYNKVGDKHYSYNSWEMYARKVPLLQVAKYMPKSVELQQALESEDAAERGITIDLNAAMGLEPENDPTPQQQPKEPDRPAQQQAQQQPKEEKKPAPRGKSKQDPPPKQEEKPQPEGEQKDGAPFEFDDVMKAIADAKTLAELDVAADLVRSFPDEHQRTLLNTMVVNKRGRLATDVNLKME